MEIYKNNLRHQNRKIFITPARINFSINVYWTLFTHNQYHLLCKFETVFILNIPYIIFCVCGENVYTITFINAMIKYDRKSVRCALM